MEIGLKIIPFNRRMRKAREKGGLTQKQLADLAGCSPNLISAIERFTCSVNEAVASEIALVLGYDVDYLFPPESRNFKSVKTRSIEFVAEIISIDQLPSDVPALALPSPEDEFIQAEMIEAVHRIVDTLPSKERKIIQIRWGLDGYEPSTLDETAMRLNTSRERIRQIEEIAIRRLRHPMRSQQLRQYLHE